MAEPHQKKERETHRRGEGGSRGGEKRREEKRTETDLRRGSLDSAGFQLKHSTGSWQLQGERFFTIVNGIAVMDRWMQGHSIWIK